MTKAQMAPPTPTQTWHTYLLGTNCSELKLLQWAEITGIGASTTAHGQYKVTSKGVDFRGYTEAEIENASTEQQIFMLKMNSHQPLVFPFGLQRLLDFVDGPDGNIGGRHFEFPEGFREAAEMLLSPTVIPAKSISYSESNTDHIVQPDPDEVAAILAPQARHQATDELIDTTAPDPIIENDIGILDDLPPVEQDTEMQFNLKEAVDSKQRAVNANEPPLKFGKNSRAAMEKWVTWQSQELFVHGDTVDALARKIVRLAERWSYESERGPLTTASAIRMIPAGLTGGRAKPTGREKNLSKLELRKIENTSKTRK